MDVLAFLVIGPWSLASFAWHYAHCGAFRHDFDCAHDWQPYYVREQFAPDGSLSLKTRHWPGIHKRRLTV